MVKFCLSHVTLCFTLHERMVEKKSTGNPCLHIHQMILAHQELYSLVRLVRPITEELISQALFIWSIHDPKGFVSWPRLTSLTVTTLLLWMQVPLVIMAKKMEAAKRRRQNTPNMIRSRA